MDIEEALKKIESLIKSKEKAPSPLDVWESFKIFSLEEIESEDDFVMVQVGDSDVMEDSYLDFCRELTYRDEDGDSCSKQIHAEFKCKLPDKLGYEAEDCVSDDYPNLNDFFNAVEAMPEFKAALEFPGWSFELYLEEV
mgnify:CR=1 FL=1